MRIRENWFYAASLSVHFFTVIIIIIIIIISIIIIIIIIIIKAAFPERNGNFPEKKSASKNEKINSRSALRSNTYPDVSKAEIKKKWGSN